MADPKTTPQALAAPRLFRRLRAPASGLRRGAAGRVRGRAPHRPCPAGPTRSRRTSRSRPSARPRRAAEEGEEARRAGRCPQGEARQDGARHLRWAWRPRRPSALAPPQPVFGHECQPGGRRRLPRAASRPPSRRCRTSSPPATRCSRTASCGSPPRPERPSKSEGGHAFRIASDYEPKGDQPTAIADLVSGIGDGDQTQVLLGVTGSGKTFTVANVIERTQRAGADPRAQQDAGGPALRRVQELLPRQRGGVFRLLLRLTTSRKPTSPRSDTFIEKESSINEQIDRMRHHAATRAAAGARRRPSSSPRSPASTVSARSRPTRR